MNRSNRAPYPFHSQPLTPPSYFEHNSQRKNERAEKLARDKKKGKYGMSIDRLARGQGPL